MLNDVISIENKLTLIILKILFFCITGRWNIPAEKYNKILHTYEYIIKNLIVIEDFILYHLYYHNVINKIKITFKRVVEIIFS